MTDVHDLLEDIRGTAAYERFDEGNDAYLAHVFCNAKSDEEIVEVGFYDPEDDKITVFTTDPVGRKPAEEAFKESGKIEELSIDDVAIGLAKARSLAAEHREKKYPEHPVSQEICILQQLGGQPVWNLTLVTATLNMLNLRLDASSGDVLQEDMRNILSLRK